VGQASGVQLDDDLADRSLAEFEALEALPERGSMAYDLLAGRRMELDTLNGSAVRLGQRYGVDTPLNRAIMAALLPYKDGTPAQPA
jgi:2-dehydropantoate 2-reductase